MIDGGLADESHVVNNQRSERAETFSGNIVRNLSVDNRTNVTMVNPGLSVDRMFFNTDRTLAGTLEQPMSGVIVDKVLLSSGHGGEKSVSILCANKRSDELVI